MVYGDELKRAIDGMGLKVNKFALLCQLPNGKHPTPPAIWNIIKNPTREKRPESDLEKSIAEVLNRRCRCCRQYTEKEDAWDNPKTDNGEGGGGRKT